MTDSTMVNRLGDVIAKGFLKNLSPNDIARAVIEALEEPSDSVTTKLIEEIAGYTGETVTKAEAIEIFRSSLNGEGE